ncbi:MAG: LPS export ABC transporter permease LptF [Syntrophaceae bacterium]
MKRILNTYIIKEISFPFSISLLILTFILLIGKILQLMELMVNKGVSFLAITKLILYLMPSFLIFTIPIALLISILTALGRLSADSEIVVMKASGVSLYQIVQPIIALSLAASLVTAALGMFVAPFSNHASKSLLFSIIQNKASVGIKEKVFNDDFSGLVIYAERIPTDGESMESVFIYDTRLTSEPSTILARRGKLYSNPQSMSVTLRLEDGSVHSVNASLAAYKKTAFKLYDIQLDMAAVTAKPAGKSKVELSLRELARMRKTIDNPKERRELTTEYHKKFAVPFACLIFGVLGVPLGITSRRSGKSRGFSVGIGVVLFYYVMQLAGDALGETGRIPPVIGAWAPNMVFLAAALITFVMAAKEISPGRIVQRTRSIFK